MAETCQGAKTMRFVPSPPVIERPDLPTLWLLAPPALDLLARVGLPREEFGAVDPRDLAARCRRRLWPIARNEEPTGHLRHRTRMLVRVAEAAEDGMALFS